jgi:hypothetical protein
MSDLIRSATGYPSGLSDVERRALIRLGIAYVAEVEGVGDQDAADLLDLAGDTGDARIIGNRHMVSLQLYGYLLVVVERWRLRGAVAAGN